MTTVGLSRSGAGHVQPSKSNAGSANACSFGHLQTAVEVIGRARALARHHRRAERGTRRALLAERGALVRLDQTLQHLTAAAQRRLLGVDVADVEAVFGIAISVLRRHSPATVGDRADAAPAAVGHL